MTPKTNLVRLRLTELEREAWAKAAGGKGKLSEWIRAVCNQAALPGGLSGPGGVLTVPREEPVVARPRARADEAPAAETKRALTTSGTEQQALPSVQNMALTSLPPGAVVPVQAGEDTERAAVKAAAKNCTRWMHHRKSVYCGTCKRVN
jgi:hypothetical protein